MTPNHSVKWAAAPTASSWPIMTIRMTTWLLFASFVLVSVLSNKTARASGEPEIPSTLAEAHLRLEQILSAEDLQKIDDMKSEREIGALHFSLGMGIRNSWGLWGGSALADHMRELGFVHADDMSSVIMGTFWCKRHGKPFRLEERAAYFAAYWESVRKEQEEELERVEVAKKRIRSMMMGLELKAERAVVVTRPDRARDRIRVRYLAQYAGGVVLAVRRLTGTPDRDFVTVPYFFLQ